MKCTAYPLGTLTNLKFTVILARYRGRWILCKQRERTSWETPGGHIEAGETPLEGARRELYEETGALEFDIEPAFEYWACNEPHEDETVSWANGAVFLARVHAMGPLPESEMERVGYFETLPESLTYPDITPVLFSFLSAMAGLPFDEIRSASS